MDRRRQNSKCYIEKMSASNNGLQFMVMTITQFEIWHYVANISHKELILHIEFNVSERYCDWNVVFKSKATVICRSHLRMKQEYHYLQWEINNPNTRLITPSPFLSYWWNTCVSKFEVDILMFIVSLLSNSLGVEYIFSLSLLCPQEWGANEWVWYGESLSINNDLQ